MTVSKLGELKSPNLVAEKAEGQAPLCLPAGGAFPAFQAAAESAGDSYLLPSSTTSLTFGPGLLLRSCVMARSFFNHGGDNSPDRLDRMVSQDEVQAICGQSLA
jgi:hypothetical protein